MSEDWQLSRKMTGVSMAMIVRRRRRFKSGFIQSGE
jgi:hypothetical protein